MEIVSISVLSFVLTDRDTDIALRSICRCQDGNMGVMPSQFQIAPRNSQSLGRAKALVVISALRC